MEFRHGPNFRKRGFGLRESARPNPLVQQLFATNQFMEKQDDRLGGEAGSKRQEQEEESGRNPHSEEQSEQDENSDDAFHQSEARGEDEDSESQHAPRQAVTDQRNHNRLSKTRWTSKHTEPKSYELRRESQRDKARSTDDKHDKEAKISPSRKEDERNLEVYIRIVDYLKKIEWDQQNAQNKMNPYHFMTAACFWFVVCAEYFSYNFFMKKNPEEAVQEVMARVNRLNYPVPTRFSKNFMVEPPHPYPNFETKGLLDTSEKVTEVLKDMIPYSHYEYYYQQSDRALTITDAADDDQFRSSTRALLYHHVEKNYKDRLAGYLNVPIPQEEEPYLDQADLEDENQEESKMQAEKDDKESKEGLEKDKPQEMGTEKQEGQDNKEANQQVDKEKNLQNQKQTEKSKQKAHKKPVKKKRQLGQQQLLLSGIMHLPLDKVISILSAQLPENHLPKIEEPLISVSSDPFQLISQSHPLQQQFLQYLKLRKRRENLEEASRPAHSKSHLGTAHIDAATEDAKCQICTDGDYTQDNLIVFCSMCNISLHQRCVGLVKVPSESWICDVCLAFGPKGRWLPCALCAVKGGALKRTTISSDTPIFKETNPSYHQYLRGCSHLKSKQEYVDQDLRQIQKRLEKEKEKINMDQEDDQQEDKVVDEGQAEAQQKSHLQPKPQGHEQSQTHSKGQAQPHAHSPGKPSAHKQQQRQFYYNYYNPESAVQDLPDCHFVWIHYTCAIWTPEVYFQQRNGLINIKGVETIDKKRFKIMCEVCQTSRTGACVKCAEDGCNLHYHAECARKAGVYMEQRYIDRMQYFIYCNYHKPLKVCRVIEAKNKKYKDEIIKFCRNIEKYVETYRIANVPFKLLKSAKKNSKIKKETRVRESREDRQSENQDFMRKLKDYLLGNRKLVIQLRKVTDGYRVIDIEEPVKRALRSNISKNDEIWEFFNYRNLSAFQLFKKYKRIMKENAMLREDFIRDIKNQSKSQRKKEKRRARQEEIIQTEQDPNKPYCLCRGPYIGGEMMLECEVCESWFHAACIGFVGEEKDANTIQFNCYRCERYQSPQDIARRKQKYKSYYNPNFVVVYPQENEFGEVIDPRTRMNQQREQRQAQKQDKPPQKTQSTNKEPSQQAPELPLSEQEKGKSSVEGVKTQSNVEGSTTTQKLIEQKDDLQKQP